MTEPAIPRPILELADARQLAREARDWTEADRLRAEIETAGWRVVDQATSYRLTPAHPPDIAEGSRVRYGSSATVPARFDEPRTGFATIVVVATDPSDLLVTVAALRAHSPTGSQVVIVSDGPLELLDEMIDRLEQPATDRSGDIETEIVLLREGSGLATAANAGIRRAHAATIVLLEAGVSIAGDLVTPLVEALGDPSVAVAGPWGSVTSDLRRFTDVPSGDVDVLAGECMAFRAADYVERGPLDERLRLLAHLGAWWCLVLRDEGDELPARRAICIAGLPIARGDRRDLVSISPTDRVRLEKRGFHRVHDRFGQRRDLLGGPRP